MRASPFVHAASILSLALGVGVLTAVGTAAYELLWKPLPYGGSERIGVIQEIRPDGEPTGVALTNLFDFRDAGPFESMAAYRPRTFGLRRAGTDDRAVVIDVGVVTSEFFTVLGTEPILGRTFTEDEEIADAPVIVLSHRLWSSRLGADPNVVGRPVLLNERPRTVLGILPEGFEFPMGPQAESQPVAYVPIPHLGFAGKRSVRTLGSIARLKNDASFERAGAALDTLARTLGERFPDTNDGFGARIIPLHSALSGPNRAALGRIGWIALAIVAIVGVNLTGLWLAHLVGRERELGVRIALGAGRLWLARLFGRDAVFIGVAGAALGLGVAHAILRGLSVLLPLAGGSRDVALSLVPASIGLAILGALAAAVPLFALPLLWSLRARLGELLRSGGFSSVSSLRSRRALVVLQVGLGLVLLHTTFLLGRSFVELMSVDPGFDPEDTVTFGIGLPEARYQTGAELMAFHRRLIESLEAVSGVRAVGAGSGALLSGRVRMRAAFLRQGDSAPRVEWPSAAARLATPGLFRALGARTIRGRTFTWRDDIANPRVIVVNDAFQRKYFPNEELLGQRLRLSWRSDENPAGTLFEIIGVVRNVRQASLREEAAPEIVMAMAQFPGETMGAVYAIRSASGNPGVANAIRREVDTLDGTLEAIRIRPLEERVDASVQAERVSLVLAGALGAAALALAAIGIYSVLALFVWKRRRELAIRCALGARPADVSSIVAREGARLWLMGGVVGALGLALSAPVVASLLFGVSPLDPTSLVATWIGGGILIALASALPTRAAGRLDIVELLRND